MTFNCLNCFNFRYAHGCLTNFEWHNLVLFILFYSIYLQSHNFISFPSLFFIFIFMGKWATGYLERGIMHRCGMGRIMCP